MHSTKNLLNEYICQRCRKKIVTVEIDEGTTPFMIRCQFCKEQEIKIQPEVRPLMQSRFYQVNQNQIPEYEWFKPHKEKDYKQYVIDKAHEQHYNLGGLFLRPASKNTIQHYSTLRCNVPQLERHDELVFFQYSADSKHILMAKRNCPPNKNIMYVLVPKEGTNIYQIASIIAEQGPAVAMGMANAIQFMKLKEQNGVIPLFMVPMENNEDAKDSNPH
jgi:hypothetical protein